MSALPEPQRIYTYHDYKNFPDNFRCDIINGVICQLPSPSREHQRLSVRLTQLLANFLEGKPCEVYHAPFDVLLPDLEEDEEDSTNVVQPDLVVYCSQKKLTAKGATGGPDLVIEILSPSTAVQDQTSKAALYARHGVREFWIIDPIKKWLKVFLLSDEGKFVLREEARPPARVGCEILEGLVVDLEELFREPAT